VAKELSRHLRAGDLAGRWGGEEFVLILPGSNVIGARLAAERIRKGLEAMRIESEHGLLEITASFGGAAVCGPGCAKRSEELFARAHAALYDAKRSGSNRVVIADQAQVPAAE